ncbi:DUF2470 domain-containing protein [Streptomyces sp. H27-C3]|uniref:DUF2470 domain-containing protein n=1 Tax=Streptomyces sp. H27-C3 TaxID=3046305 RepID=UPI0024B9455E|nr:DUF2470 domain-containing protein [Streptomyces sp. H27-C3]MDJ0466676.1 DUF2470 domain-containing protein [Streptomyces sp. H27-C3]
MRPHRTRAPQSTPAERVQSILRAAQSMTVVSDGLHAEVNRLNGAGAMGHIHLHAPCEDAPAAPHTRLPVRLELTDIAPTVVRERLRARVTLTGLLAAPYSNDSAQSTCMEFGQAVLEDAEGRHFITLDELWAASPDPIAMSEAEMLTHLVDSHGELVPLLVRLVHPRPERDRLRAVPLAMDRYGVTLRLEYPTTHLDVRLPFAIPVSGIEQAGPQIHGLLARARRASHRNRLLTIHEM